MDRSGFAQKEIRSDQSSAYIVIGVIFGMLPTMMFSARRNSKSALVLKLYSGTDDVISTVINAKIL